MIITWYGLSCIKIETQDTILACDPFNKSAEWGADRSPRFRADVVCVSMNDPLYNASSGIEGNPFIIDSPGEYEIKGVRITGIPRVSDKGVAHTIYVIQAEGLTVVHAGAWAGAKISESLKVSCGGADVVCLPVSGGLLLDAAQAATVARQLEAAIVVPVMHQGASARKETGPVAKLAKNMNLSLEYQDKLSLRGKSAAPEHGRIVVLSPQLIK